MDTPNDRAINHAHSGLPDRRAVLESAEAGVAGIRGSLLLAAQNGFSAHHIENAAQRMDLLEADAAMSGLSISGYGERLRELVRDGKCHANAALDVVAAAEASLLEFSFRSDDFLADLDSIVESSFGDLTAQPKAKDPDLQNDDDWDELDVDDETLEIFQDEAAGLLANIRANLQALAGSPADTNALWEIRRNAHTFKGAAGIVGLKSASTLAHRVEDLLDKMVEYRHSADADVLALLSAATDSLSDLTSTKQPDDAGAAQLNQNLERALARIADPRRGVAAKHANAASPGTSTAGPASAPIVRVSLERLDEIIALAQTLTQGPSGDEHSTLSAEIIRKLRRLRMVRFGTVETRLSRAVHVTCQEENKRAELSIEGAGVEVDTQIIDALIEPLIHVLKNAVVHGIESAEVRRLLGKPEKGSIKLTVTVDESNAAVTICDDGSGIATDKLLKKAIDSGTITPDAARSMSEQDVLELIFHRGLTTAQTLNLNAGRGVGMSIVRQSIEDRGGTVSLTSKPQKGTAFHLTVPLVRPVKKQELPAFTDGAPLVLVVDDSDSIRRQTAKFIEDRGVTAITAADAAEALELLLNGLEPALILSDVEMPNMNGWEFLEYVKSDENFGHVPMVMVTSLDADRYRNLAARLGASDYIVKPFGPKDLARMLDKFCALNR